MKWVIVCAVLLVAGSGLGQDATKPGDSGHRRHGPLNSLGSRELQACGLNNLTDEQQDHLLQTLHVVESPSFVERSATRFLEREGYKQIRVVGGVPESREYSRGLVFISVDYELIALEPPLLIDLPVPGYYLAKNSGTTWNFILRDGQDALFWEKDLD